MVKYSYSPCILHGGQDPEDRYNTLYHFRKGER